VPRLIAFDEDTKINGNILGRIIHTNSCILFIVCFMISLQDCIGFFFNEFYQGM